MMGKLRLAVAMCAATFLLSGVLSTSATAASIYGPAGLGSNLHRRFVVKQAVKNTRVGQPVRNRAILWQARPYTRGSIVTSSRWRRR